MGIARRALCVSCALALGPASVASADHAWELTGRLGQIETDQDLDTDMSYVSATYYFDPVDDGLGPYALAPFLDPATRVSISASEADATSPTGDLDNETSDYSVSGQYLLAQSKWYVGGRYTDGEIDEPPPQFTPIASSTGLQAYGLTVGKYLGAGATRLQLSLDRSEIDSNQTFSFCFLAGCVNATADVVTTTDEVAFDVMHVRPFRAATYVLRGGVSERNGDTVGALVVSPNPILPPFPNQTIELDLGTLRRYSVGGELFPLVRLGVRLGYTRLDGESSSGDVVDVGASWYFNRNVGLDLVASRHDAEDIAADEIALRVIGRF